MKILSRSFLRVYAIVLLMALLTVNVFAGGSDPKKEKDLYVLKTDKSFVGAKVDIYSAKGSVMTSQLLTKRKMVIDFSDVREGNYIIRVSKGNKVREFEFHKS